MTLRRALMLAAMVTATTTVQAQTPSPTPRPHRPFECTRPTDVHYPHGQKLCISHEMYICNDGTWEIIKPHIPC